MSKSLFNIDLDEQNDYKLQKEVKIIQNTYIHKNKVYNFHINKLINYTKNEFLDFDINFNISSSPISALNVIYNKWKTRYNKKLSNTYTSLSFEDQLIYLMSFIEDIRLENLNKRLNNIEIYLDKLKLGLEIDILE